MKTLAAILVLAGTRAAFAASASAPVEVPVPNATGWAVGLLLGAVWLFVAAAAIGPVVHYLRLEPRSTQRFIDDKRPGL